MNSIGIVVFVFIPCLIVAACVQAPPRPLAVSAASSARGRVDAQDMGADAAQRYATSATVQYVQPLGYPENAMPDYPRELLAMRLPEVVVHARVVVDASGRVTDVVALDGAAADAQQSRFF